tara:strand:- start:6232 stop:6498 length:267 start_codon:yes stop_codon:yes gene_type:complete
VQWLTFLGGRFRARSQKLTSPNSPPPLQPPTDGGINTGVLIAVVISSAIIGLIGLLGLSSFVSSDRIKRLTSSVIGNDAYESPGHGNV